MPGKLIVSTIGILLLGCALLGTVLCDFSLATDLSSYKMVVIRAGFWSALEARHVDPKPGEDILTKVTTPYGEIHFSLGLKKGFAVGFSTGSCYRGETRYSDPDGYYWKRVSIYPFTTELKYYPLHRVKKSRWQPYLDGGAGLISGTEILRFGEYSGPLLLLGSSSDTYLTFGWHVGGGMDYVLSKSFAVGLDFKYRGVNFGDEIGGMKNYSGPEATLGISYIFKAL
jgi:hypothetical protein